MAYTVYESNLAQSAANAAAQVAAAEVGATGDSGNAVETFEALFDSAFAKLKSVYDNDSKAHEAQEQAKATTKRNTEAQDSPGEVKFNFGAAKGLSVAKVAEMDEAALKAHGEKLVEDGWTGDPYEKGGQAYLKYVANSNNKKLGYMKKVVNNFFDSKRA